ncbi:MAG TPA: 16S rRNA processing protein RimM [Clostridium sp.]|jgi:16S rRNA processing protein RimM|uniref:ribosome maturation factor RimM n=1 Tax=unclassified Clostridium TaxID=2614128 RepID=UPI000ECEB359|nr:16S rRNA processing protein RimM [Clostridium sp.]
MRELMSVGQITKPHGVRGEVKVFSLTDSLERFRELDRAYIDDKEVNITSVKLQKDRAILKIEGIDSIEEADLYRNKYLQVKREDAIKLPEGSYYVADLMDCYVYDTDGEELGKVYDVIATGSNDVYWVKSEGKEDVLIPVLKTIVEEVDIENNKIIIKPVKVWSE